MAGLNDDLGDKRIVSMDAAGVPGHHLSRHPASAEANPAATLSAAAPPARHADRHGASRFLTSEGRWITSWNCLPLMRSVPGRSTTWRASRQGRS